MAVKSDTAKENASDKDPRYWVMPMGNWADPLIKWLETRFRPPTQNKKPSSDTGLTQDQNMRGHHADPFFTDAAIVQ